MSDATPPGQVGYPPVRRREIFGWCCYDFANSAFTTIIITVVYAIYFQQVVAEGHPHAESWLGRTLSGSGVVVLLLAPLIGAVADVRARKKAYLIVTAFTCSLATMALVWVGPGMVFWALLLLAIANTTFALGENLCAAFLPEISTPRNVGRISGYGWSFGYFGGLISLVLALLIIQSGEGRVHWTFLMTGLFFMITCVPTLLLLRERAQPRALAPGESYPGLAWGQLRQMRHDLPKHRTLAWFFCAMTVYLTGLMAVIGFAGLYATNVVGMTQAEIIQLFIVLQLAGVAGAFSFGFLQDRIGSKTALVAALILWVIVCVWAAVCRTKAEFFAIGVIAGVAMGSLQSAGRAVVATLTPAGRSGEFFGYWGFFGKLAGVFGPLAFGEMVKLGGYRLAIVVTGGFFLVGFLMLLPLRLKQPEEKVMPIPLPPAPGL
jgi:MFS transporter, UMF1 family